MNKYNIENNIDFYAELYKSLDDNECDLNSNDKKEEDTCLITSLPLEEPYIILECKHKFNYVALFNEIYNQIFKFKTYSLETLTPKEVQHIRKNSKDNLYIKCPYCRNIQFTLLPFYEHFGVKKVYGINTDEVTFRQIKRQTDSVDTPFYSYNDNYISKTEYMKYGMTFVKGQQCNKILNYTGNQCSGIYTTPLHGTDKCYCHLHIKTAIREKKIADIQKQKEKKQKQKEEKQKQKEELKKQKEELKKQKEELKKQKEELKKQKEELKKQKQELISKQDEVKVDDVSEGCISILKSGTNKGKKCGCKIFENNMCKRHSKIVSNT
jgi:hypothetical protein